MMDQCESIRGERRLLALFLGLNWPFFSQVTLELTPWICIIFWPSRWQHARRLALNPRLSTRSLAELTKGWWVGLVTKLGLR
jgi:hypothetical protein